MKKQPVDQYKPAEKLELEQIKKEFPKVFRKINCPSCKQDIPADHLNLQNSLAKCGNCNVIFSIEEEVKTVQTKEEMKQEVFRPEGIDLFYYKDDLDITVQQHIHGVDAAGLFLLPTIALFSILLYFAKGIPILFPVLFTLGSLYFIWKGLNYSTLRDPLRRHAIRRQWLHPNRYHHHLAG